MAEADWILERERRQMEQILELDMEELQVEEVDDDGSTSSSSVDTFLRNIHGDGGSSTSEALTSNMSLVFLPNCDGAATFTSLFPHQRFMVPQAGVVLFPEAILPLRVVQPRSLAAVDKAVNHVDTPCMIGVVHVYRHNDDAHHAISSVGTTAEIQQIKQLDDGSSNVVTRGQHRFRLRRCWIDADDVQWGEIQIIEEDTPQRTPRDAFGQLAANFNFNQCGSSLASSGMSYFRQNDHVDSDQVWDSLSSTSTSSEHSVTDARRYSSNEDEDRMHEQSWQKHDSVGQIAALGNPVKHSHIRDNDEPCFRLQKTLATRNICAEKRVHCVAYSSKLALQAPLSFWPRWAYEMYDSYSLARRAADLWRQIIVNPSVDDYVRKPDILSYHIGSKLPLPGSVRQELLEIDGISYRLQKEIQLLKAYNIIRCRNCLTFLTKRSDGPVGAYIKQFGRGQEMMTVHNATGLAVRGNPSKAHSLFSGYTWTIALCAACESNIGWLFQADKKNLLPKSFWGLRCPQISDDIESGHK
uniref:Protein cereblon n=1 Tax=Leersia perrieri TaxID=77586 RepID=A0A0D9V5I5_9ORYZ